MINRPSPTAHPHAIRCIHTHGWHTRHWCRSCLNHWVDVCGTHYCQTYELNATLAIVHAIFVEMEDGDLPIPAAILNLDLTDILADASAPPEPSQN